jgi:hypothetical protein
MKNHIPDTCKLDMALVPPVCYRHNTAEVATSNFKAHILSILAGVADNFTPNLWHCLLPQTKISNNLIQQSNATPNILAYAHLSGSFDYNTMPLAPMGCEAQVHEKTDKRCTWAYHLVKGWYLFTSPENYCNTQLSQQSHQERMTIQHSLISTQTHHQSLHHACR